jgi:hypothetical protein
MAENMKQPPSAGEPKKKNKKLWIWLTVVIFILVLIPVLVLGYTGIYNIPIVTNIFGSNKPIDLGVHPTEGDLKSAEADNPMTITTAPGTFYWTNEKIYSGTVAIDDVNSSEEVTAFIEKYHGDGRHVKDIQIKYRDGGMEISGFVSPYIKAPVYVDVDVSRTSNTSVSLNLIKAKVGRLTIPSSYYDEITTEAERLLNREIKSVPGFILEELEYRDGEAYLKGTLPETVSTSTTEQRLDEFLK